MTTLVDRYVSAAAQHVPDKQRADVASELRTSIEDAVDARTADGVDQTTAEREVLLDLGDPERLAAGLTGRQLVLIGPRLYVQWWGVLRALLAVVVPIVVVVVAVVSAATGDSLVDVLLGSLWLGLTVALHLCFWVTLTFAIVERTGAATDDEPWDPDSLPDERDPAVTLSGTIWSIAMLALLFVVVIGQRSWSWVTDDAGDAVPLLSPDLWSSWLPFLLGVIVVTIGFHVVLQLSGRWTYPLAHANTVLQLLFAVPVIYLLASGQLLNPAFFDAVGWPQGSEPTSPVSTITILVVAVDAVIESVNGYRNAARSNRPLVASTDRD